MADRIRSAAVQWLKQFWADLAASTDAGLLSVLRFLGLLYGPIDSRLPIGQAFRKALRYRLAPHVGWRHALGGITYLLFIFMVVTGVLLSIHYRPSAQEAYPSIQHIVSNVTLGWLFRDLHVWVANLLVLTMLAHMAQVFFDGAYKPPRETSWLLGVLLLFSVLAFGATGSLLPWDQGGYWTVTEALNVVAGFPLIGGLAVGLLRGDPIVSGATLSRFFAIHVIVLPWLAFVLLVFHFTVVRRQGIAPPVRPRAESGAGRVFFPSHLLRSFMVAVLVCAVSITFAVLFPRPVGDVANPAAFPNTIPSTWLVVDVSRALMHYLGVWGFAAFTLLAVGLALVPIFDRGPERDLRRRPVIATLGVIFMLGFVLAWVAGQRLRDVPPDASLAPAPSSVPAPPGTAGAVAPADSVSTSGGPQ
jgi:quinol-cytochrome oxidoreductase complex cytochrome b subunit